VLGKLYRQSSIFSRLDEVYWRKTFSRPLDGCCGLKMFAFI
jgi:hypothetical protein